MNALGTPDVVLITSRVLRMDPRNALELIDVPATEETIAEAAAEASPTAASAALLHGLVTRRPIARANDRVALVAAMQLMGQHGWDVELGEDAHDLVAGVRSGELSRGDVERWLAARSRPARPSRRQRVTKRAAVVVLAAALVASVAFLAVDHKTNRHQVAALDHRVSTLQNQVHALRMRAMRLQMRHQLESVVTYVAADDFGTFYVPNGRCAPHQPGAGTICVPSSTFVIRKLPHTNP